MLSLSGAAPSLDEARRRVRQALDSGAGLRKLQEVIERQGGDPRVVDDPSRLPQAAERIDLPAEAGGAVTSIACRDVGRAAMLLGAGRETVASRIDPAVGVVLHKKAGDSVAAGEPLATLHVNDRARLEEASALLRRAIRVGAAAPAPGPLIDSVLE
jgi:pyrimidine-nucleoside phosphorylase